jgi:hypothetical protein
MVLFGVTVRPSTDVLGAALILDPGELDEAFKLLNSKIYPTGNQRPSCGTTLFALCWEKEKT